MLFLGHSWLKYKLFTWFKSKNIPKNPKDRIQWILPYMLNFWRFLACLSHPNLKAVFSSFISFPSSPFLTLNDKNWIQCTKQDVVCKKFGFYFHEFYCIFLILLESHSKGKFVSPQARLKMQLGQVSLYVSQNLLL